MRNINRMEASPLGRPMAKGNNNVTTKNETHDQPSGMRHEYRANGFILSFGYPSDNNVAVHYTDYCLLKTGWVEGFQKRSLVMTFNNQCPVANVVMGLKQAADALGIVFGDAPTLTVEQPDNPPPGHNWRQLSEASAARLGWKLIHSFDDLESDQPFEMCDD